MANSYFPSEVYVLSTRPDHDSYFVMFVSLLLNSSKQFRIPCGLKITQFLWFGLMALWSGDVVIDLRIAFKSFYTAIK